MLLAKNRKAHFNHEILKRFVAGIVLKGYEVKALREGKAAFEGAYVKLDKNRRPIVMGLHIGRYSKQSKEFDELSAIRDRELLLNKKEIDYLYRELSQKGKTAIPLALILRNNKVKLEFALVKGRKKVEQKHLIKERELEIDLKRQTKVQQFE